MEEMVEDIMFEVPETGDPEPKLKESDRKRLDSIVQKMIQNGEGDDAIGLVVNDFKSKYATKALVAPEKTTTKVATKIEPGREMASVFGGAKGQSVASVTGAAQGVMPKPTREMIKENKAIGELKNSKTKIIEEIKGNDDVVEKIIRKSRLDNAAAEQPHPTSDMPQTSSELSAQMLLPQEVRPHEQPVTPEEIAAFKIDTEQDETMSRGFLDKIIENKPDKKKDIQKSVYLVDAMNRVQQSPDKEKTLDKVALNSEKLSKGELIYNVKNGMLIKPEGVLGSLITGWQHKSKGYHDYSFLNNKSDQEIIEEYEKRRTEYDPDDPIPVPKHKVAELTQMAGSMPLKSIVAGGVVSAAGAPQAAPFVAGAVGAADFYRLGYANSFANVYNQLRDEGKSPEEAVKMAKAQANKEAVIDAAVGGSMAMAGARIGMKPISFSQGYKSAIADFAKGAGKEGGIQSLIGAGGEVAKNKLAQAAGITRETDANVLEAIESNFLMTAGFGAVAQLGRGIPKLKYRSILNGLKKVPENVMEANIQSELDAGRLTEQQATNIRNEVNGYKELDGQIPENVTEEARLEIQKKLEKRNELEGKLETLNKAFHPDIKEKIKVLDEEIGALARQTEKKPKEEPTIKEAKLLIDEAIEQGFMNDISATIAKDNPNGFMKFVADQSFGRLDDGELHGAGGVEGQMREQFGDAIVDKAKEMFPLEEKKSSISVIMPEEQRPVEATTVSGEKPVSETTALVVETQPEPVAATTESQPELIGITHAQMDNVARELGLPEYQQDPESFDLWMREAKDRLAKDPDAINKVINKLRRGDMPDPVETQIMKLHFAALKAKYDKSPTPELLAELNRTKNLYNISGRQEAKSLVARKGLIPVEDSLADFHMTDVEFNRAPLTEKQTEQSTKDYQEIAELKKSYEEKIAQLKSDDVRKKAEKEIGKIKSEGKKEKKDYATERKSLIEQLKQQKEAHIQKMKEQGIQQMGGLGPKLALTPEMLKTIGKLVKNIVEDGISRGVEKFEDFVKAVHDELTGVIDNIEEKDVVDILGGEYAQKKSRSKTAEKLYDLKTQARLINKLESLEAGVQPKSEKQRIKRNQEIEELKNKIGEHDLTKLAALKTRTKNELAKVEKELEDIKKGIVPIEEEPEPLKLDKEAQDMRDKLLARREERDIRLMKMDYESIKGLEKLAREANQYLNISKQIKSTGDVSFPFRQVIVEVSSKLLSVPFKIEKGKGVVFTNFNAQKELVQAFGNMYSSLAKEKIYRRIMADIKESRYFEIAQKAGLELADPNSPLAEMREEIHFPSKLEKVPVAKNIVRGSNRAASVFSNVMKWNKFIDFVDMFEKQGMSIRNSPDAYKEAAIYANQVVGRGFLGTKLEQANWLTSRFFFSLRLQASRLQLLFKAVNPQFWTKTPKEVRLEYMKDMIKTVAMGSTVLATANAMGLSVELDPRSSEFGKVKVGDTVYDIWGGVQQYVVLFSRLLSGEYKSIDGEVKPLESGKYKFGYDDLLKNFYRSKSSPEMGTAWNLISGERIDRKPVTLEGEALDFISPIVINDIKEAYKDGGVQRALITWLLTAHGVGALTYDDKEEKKDDGKKNKRAKRPERPQRESRN